MYISVIISGFFLLIYKLGNKSVLNFFVILFFSICCFVFLSTELNRDTIIAIMIIVVIFVFHEKIFDLFNDTQKNQAIFFLILIFVFCPFIFLKTKEFNQIVKDSNNQPEFIFRKNIIGRIFDPKFFSPAQLEKNYDFIDFQGSKLALNELGGIMFNDKLPYYGFNSQFWVWYIQNNDTYTVFFVLKDYDLTVIITKKLSNEKFQIIKFLSKRLK